MEQSIQGYLGSLQVGEVQQFKNLAMVPAVSDYDDGLGYITLGDALGAGSIEIREVSEGGSVPELRVVNRAGKMVLILDGEKLVGAKQNRIVNTTILVAAGCEIVIPVSCVEQGRWTYRSDVFESKQRMISPSIRQVKARDVSASLRSTGRYRSDQSAIWEEVAGLASRRGALSESMDMDLIFDKEAPVIKEGGGPSCLDSLMVGVSSESVFGFLQFHWEASGCLSERMRPTVIDLIRGACRQAMSGCVGGCRSEPSL
jgi:hypothetical protein